MKKLALALLVASIPVCSYAGVNTVSEGFDASASGKNSIAFGTVAKAGGDDGIAMGRGASASGKSGVAIGEASKASGLTGTAVGFTAVASGEQATAIGQGTLAAGYRSTAFGRATAAVGDNGTAIGSGAKTSANNATATGAGALASAEFASAFGSQAEAGGIDSVAVGRKAKAVSFGGVALGSASVADVDGQKDGVNPLNADKVGKGAAWKSRLGSVSVGDAANGITRQLTSVAAGTNDTDAVNVAQLAATAKAAKSEVKVSDGLNLIAGVGADGNAVYTVGLNGQTKATLNQVGENKAAIDSMGKSVAKNAKGVSANRSAIKSLKAEMHDESRSLRGGIAGAAAMANLVQPVQAGQGVVTAGVGLYKSEAALAVGVGKMTDNGKWTYRGSVGFTTRKDFTIGAAVGYFF